MKVLAITFGTEGDVRPMAALCAALIGAGHEARLLAPHDALDSAQALGVPASGLAGAIRATLSAAGTTGNAAAGALGRVVNANVAAWLKRALAEGAGCDVVIGTGLAGLVGLSAAEKLGALGVGAGMFPLTPTSEFASPFVAPGALPAWANRLTFHLASVVVWRGMAGALNAARREVGLAPWRRLSTEHAMLYGVSRHLVPPPHDWPANAAICGLWQAPTPDWSPPAALSAFLAAGEAPIYVGFGSMAVAEPGRLLPALVAAVDGRRALFSPGWSGIDAPDLPANFHVVGPTPHDWLFPRCAVAIHHGGAGTTHSAARAGIPSVVAPFAGDQPFWADRLRRAGVAPAPLDLRRPDLRRIADAIGFALRPEVGARAAALGEAMAGEDGLGSAIRRLEALLAERG